MLEFPGPHDLNLFEKDPNWDPKLSTPLVRAAQRRIRFAKMGLDDAIKDYEKKDIATLKAAIRDNGDKWPSMDKVGYAAAFAAFVIAHNADSNEEFQRYCLALMREQAGEIPHLGKIQPQTLALMEEKIAEYRGESVYEPWRHGEYVGPDLLAKRLAMGFGSDLFVTYPPEFGTEYVVYYDSRNIEVPLHEAPLSLEDIA